MMREIIIIMCFCFGMYRVYRMSERDYLLLLFFVECIGYIGMMREIIIIIFFLFERYRVYRGNDDRDYYY